LVVISESSMTIVPVWSLETFKTMNSFKSCLSAHVVVPENGVAKSEESIQCPLDYQIGLILCNLRLESKCQIPVGRRANPP
jgi:hypothetical protein